MTTQQVPKVGDTIVDRYEITAMLGQGAMGCVYKATHQGLGRIFAIKIMQPQYSADPLYKTRFLREARINAQLTHPNAVQVYDTGEWEGWLYIVMEYLQGMTLRDWIIDGVPSKDNLILSVAEQISDVLVKAHDIGLVHRDLKPENIMVEQTAISETRFVVVDFGLAFIQSSEGLDRMTQDRSTISGTPAYLAPEQAIGGEISMAADIYAFGCILYELITGWCPFTANTVMEVLTQHMFVPPMALSKKNPMVTASPVMEDLVIRMLNKDPELRPSAQVIQKAIMDMINLPDNQVRKRQTNSYLERDERMVEKSTQRNQAINANASIMGKDMGRIAFFRSSLDSDSMISMASNGFSAFEAQVAEDCADALVIVAPNADKAIVAQLASYGAVIAGVEKGDMSRVQDMLQAGAADIVSTPIQQIELIKKLNRIARKAKRRKKI